MSTSNKRLSPVEWASITALYERGEASVKDLSERFGVTRAAIYKGLQDRGVQKSSKIDDARSDVDDSIRAARQAAMEKGRKLKDAYSNYADFIARLTMKKIQDGAQPGGTLAAHHADILVLGNAMKIIAKAREENWDILDLKTLFDEDDELPDLNIGEYSEEELADLRDANEAEYLSNQADDEDEAA